MPHAMTSMRLAPKRCASAPAGNATKILTSVKIDMSQEAVAASILKIPMRFVMMVGTLY